MLQSKSREARAERERSTQNANIVIPAQIAKQKAIIDAQAEAEKQENCKRRSRCYLCKMEAEAKVYMKS
jgi:flotillin